MAMRPTITITAFSLALALSACSKAPPKCSEEATATLVRQILVEQMAGVDGLDEQQLKDNLKLEFARPSAYDENIRKYSCEAKLVAAGTYQVPITYESQLDDSGQHIVSVSGMAPGDILAVQTALRGILARGPAAAAPAPAPAAAAVAIEGEWRGALDGAEGHMTLQKTAAGYSATLGMGSERCAGSFEGSGTLQGNVLTLQQTEEGETCTLTATLQGDTAQMDEDGCTAYHGMSCAFSGTLRKVQ